MTTNTPELPQPDGNRLRNLLIAIVAIVLAVVFALGLKTQTATATLPAMAKAAVPFDIAIKNGKPTLMEFYADWCSSCQAMAPAMASLKQEYGDRVNFVMLNVDNEKWLPEILSYRVDGIPHWVYLDKTGQSQAEAIGEIPRPVMAENLIALAAGTTLPNATTIAGQTSAYSPPSTTVNTTKKAIPDDPRAHGSQVKG
jgi:thiol-disulfide isomerase/thioredoxin